jgi:pilus assembly protein TadC
MGIISKTSNESVDRELQEMLKLIATYMSCGNFLENLWKRLASRIVRTKYLLSVTNQSIIETEQI